MKKKVISLSGGLDSTTVLARALADGHCVAPVFFNYGSKHNAFEQQAVNDIVAFYSKAFPGKVDPLRVMDLTGVFGHMESNLLLHGGPIPEGHYEQENMKLTVVPGRNSVFIAILTGLAESMGANGVAVGIHQGDHAIYPDCRQDYFKTMKEAMYLASGGSVVLYAPFLYGNKATIVKEGLALGVPYLLTRTCYKAQGAPCGVCGSCTERLEAFALNNAEDPVTYFNPGKEGQ